MALKIGVLNETSGTERRVSLVPDDARKLISTDLEILVQSGSGMPSGFSDSDYTSAGCTVLSRRTDIISAVDFLIYLGRPLPEDIDSISRKTTVIGLIYPTRNTALVEQLSAKGATVYSLELLPRTTRAQSMDVLSSQSSVAGYRAAITGAFYMRKLMPMLTTAAGTVKPASVLVIGAGVAGLMAIATAKRLGASVLAYDVRKAAGDDVRSLGAKFLEVDFNAEGGGGYARTLTEDEKRRERELLESAIVSSDLIITAAGVPGKRAPVIIDTETVTKMKAGSVIVDIMAEYGGNCELTVPGKVSDHNGVMIIGLLNAQSDGSVDASRMFSKNILAFLSILIGRKEKIADATADEILSACLICSNGKITHPQLLNGGEL
ncbi:MAG: NAD(P) transhydrogenase subunit alpha [Thermoplasmataceae archaeon]